MMRTVALLCLLLAEVPPEENKVQETIVVTATRSERAVSTLPVSTAVIAEEALQSVPATAVEDVLRTLPGLQINVSGGVGAGTSQQKISMHGLGGTRALVMLDGVPIHDPYYGTVQWQKVPLDTV